MREVIRTEVGKLNPTDDARRALELIIESSVRYSDDDGRLKITVIDQAGKPRMTETNGEMVECTIHDLLEELRASHPILFKPQAKPAAEPAEMDMPERAPPNIAAEPFRPREKPERDWLKIGSAESSTPASLSRLIGSRALFHLHRGGLRLHGWSRNAFKLREASATADGPAGLHKTRHFFDSARARSLPRYSGLALGAVAIAALLGIGGYNLLGSEPSASQQASVAEPEETGSVTASAEAVDQIPSTPASSRAQTLRGVPDVIDTATLSLNGEVVRLFGVEWAPGAGKPEDLTSYLSGREVVCEPAGPNDIYRCQVGGQDLSRVVLFNGGGQPTADATPELKAAANQAREAKLGVWSGNGAN